MSLGGSVADPECSSADWQQLIPSGDTDDAQRRVRGLVSRPREQVFAHEVEAALASVFDAHRIVWLYEPHTFDLARAHDGTVTRAFTPDFFLPEIGIYVECTVARKALTTRKRQKARAAERLYGIVVEIAYRADLEELARQWSLHALRRALDRCVPPSTLVQPFAKPS